MPSSFLYYILTIDKGKMKKGVEVLISMITKKTADPCNGEIMPFRKKDTGFGISQIQVKFMHLANTS